MDIKRGCYKTLEGEIIYKEGTDRSILDFFYSNALGRAMLKLVCNKTFANIERAVLDTPVSALAIDSFIKKNDIDMSEYIPSKYNSFNEFFTRDILPYKRTFETDDKTVISPADGKITAYRISSGSRFKIKNCIYSIASLLRSEKLAKYYAGGTIVIVRLSVDDFHHFCYPVSGHKSPNRRVDGVLHTVMPLIYDYMPVYTENAREYCVITTDEGVKVTMAEIGALGVGRITNFKLLDGKVKKGYEKGMFEFGGSSVILLFPKEGIKVDERFINNTKEGYETRVKLGNAIARKN